MPHPNPQKPGIFWTWQDEQIENETLVRESISDIAARGFGSVLVQPRGCRYPMVGEPFIGAAAHASACAHEHGLAFWLHLDPRSMSRHLIDAAGEAAEYVMVAGTGGQPEASLAHRRAFDAEARLGPDGRFRIRLDYAKTRPYHVHSEGAISFRPLRLERCLLVRRGAAGVVVGSAIEDVTASARLFVNELRGYVEVFGNVHPPEEEGWCAIAFVAFGSNYPDFASDATRLATRAALDRFVEAGVRLDGLWWDEPGYCTGFDRNFANDRGRIPWGQGLRTLHQRRTGRSAVDDLVYLVAETDDRLWGERREAYYRTLEAAVFGAQADLLEHGRAVLGDHVAMGVHQTWHQNGDDVINGCMDWWRGSNVLGAGYADVGDAERIDDPEQMAEVTALGTIAVSLGRHTASRTANYNLWGVDYGTDGAVPGPDVVAWWVDLQAALGCNWLAHTYGPTGYFERPSVWGPGYPDHPTWAQMAEATDRLTRAAELARGALPDCDVALVYPLGTMYRLGSDLANPLAHGTHVVIDSLVRAGFELDVVSAETLRRCPADRYRGVIYPHPFGASPDDVEDLGRRVDSGSVVAVAGLPAVAGDGYAGADSWTRQLGIHVPELPIEDLFGACAPEPWADPSSWAYRGLPIWGRPRWPIGRTGTGGNRYLSTSEGVATSEAAASDRRGSASYLGLLLEGFGAAAAEQLGHLGLRPSWRVPQGAIASRTRLPGGGTLVRLCPGRFGRPFRGTLQVGRTRIVMENGVGLACLRVEPGGSVHLELAPDALEWAVEEAPR